jgi:hypothetical protein
MSSTAITIPAPPAPATSHPVQWWHEKDGFSFHDVLDTINPLQHIPIVGSIYRAITHDEPGAVARILGDGLFGGGPLGALIGLFTGALDVLVQADTGKDIGENLLALAGLDGGDGTPPGTAVKTAAAPRTGIPLSPARYILPTAPPAGAPSAGVAGRSAGVGTTPGSSTKPAPGSAANPPAAFSASTALARPRGPSLLQRPVPLRVTGLLLPGGHPHPLPAAPGSTASPADVSTAAADNPAGTILPAAPPAAGATADRAIRISEKMSEALDKYARMMQQRHAKPPPGSQVNVVQ